MNSVNGQPPRKKRKQPELQVDKKLCISCVLVLDLDHTLGDFDYLLGYLHLLTSMLISLSMLPYSDYPFSNLFTGKTIIALLRQECNFFFDSQSWKSADRIMDKVIPYYRKGFIQRIVVFTAGKPRRLSHLKEGDLVQQLRFFDDVEYLEETAQSIILSVFASHYNIPFELLFADFSGEHKNSMGIPSLKNLQRSQDNSHRLKTASLPKIKPGNNQGIKHLQRLLPNKNIFVIDDYGGVLYRQHESQNVFVYKISKWVQKPHAANSWMYTSSFWQSIVNLLETDRQLSFEEEESSCKSFKKQWSLLKQKYLRHHDRILRQRYARKHNNTKIDQGFNQILGSCFDCNV